MRHYMPKKDRNIALLTSILMKKVPYCTIQIYALSAQEQCQVYT